MPRRRYRRRNQTALKKTIRKEAKKVVDREIESKVILYSSPAAGVGWSVDYSGINVQLTDDWNTGVAVPIVQGSSNGEYIGLSIEPMYVMMTFVVSGVAADVSNFLTISLIQAKGYFIPSSTSTASQYNKSGSVDAPLGLMPPEFDKRQRVIKRKTMLLQANQQDENQTFNWKIKGKKLSKIFFANGAGSIQRNPLYLSIVSDSSAISHPVVRCVWKLFYKDA